MSFAEALLALTLNLFFEARGESERGMHAVADVTVTRVVDVRYPNNMVDVVLQPRQFSWVREQLHPHERNLQGLISLQHRVLHSGKYSSRDIEAYRRAERVARKVLQDGYRPVYHFTHFHNTKVKPYWSRLRVGVWIGNHLFYKL